LYPATAKLSVDADQLRSIRADEIDVAVRPAGAVGGELSGATLAAVRFPFESYEYVTIVPLSYVAVERRPCESC
jgi:hypothetical protein